MNLKLSKKDRIVYREERVIDIFICLKFFKTYILNDILFYYNLKKMRKENISQKFFDFINKNRKYLIQEDQTVINIVLKGRIGLLPPKFGI